MALTVEAVRYNSQSEARKDCIWLGHFSYQCGACKKGFFKVKSEDDFEDECPHCHASIVVKRDYSRPSLL